LILKVGNILVNGWNENQTKFL